MEGEGLNAQGRVQDFMVTPYDDAVLDVDDEHVYGDTADGTTAVDGDTVYDTVSLPRKIPRKEVGSQAVSEVRDGHDVRPESPTFRHVRGRSEKEKDRNVVNGHEEAERPIDGGPVSHPDGYNDKRAAPEAMAPSPTSEASTISSPVASLVLPFSFKWNKGDNDNDSSSLMYESIYSKSGENLASLRLSSDYLAMQPRENRLPSPLRSPSVSVDGRRRASSELVSGRHAGAGWSRSAIRWAPLNVPLQRRLQTLCVLMHTLAIAGSLAMFFLLCSIPILWPILLPYTIYVLLSRVAVDGRLSQRSNRARRSKIWSLFASYFPARLHRTQPLEPGRKYIFGYHPHGIISHGAFAAFATEALGFSQLFPGITNTLLTLDANFRIPIYRDYALRMGLASVSRESCENILSRGGRDGAGMGRAITIVIGGARESLDAVPRTMKLVLQRRKGFVKLAMRTGADLVPVLAFGENDLYDQLDTTRHPYIHRAQMLLKKFMGFTIPLFHARGAFAFPLFVSPFALFPSTY